MQENKLTNSHKYAPINGANKSFKASPYKASTTKLQHKSFTYKASTPKLHLQSFNHKKLHLPSFTYKTSTTKLQPQKLHLQNFTYKASPTKLHYKIPRLKHVKASHTLDQDSVKLNQVSCPKNSFNLSSYIPKQKPTTNTPYLFTYICFQTYYNRSNNKSKSQLS
ncbi:hypothetical protein C1H46_012898 [Malus baccata]|uniref:Uncharacterized protein n=1 Tax=Malus baccata TaxID=106549 RepID=A0A540MRW1_MALBA|nr:hypothetical protein C1H46_012898 [Malus baccata]